MMESCFNDKVARAETILVDDLRRDLRFDLTEMAAAQVSPHPHLCSPGSGCSGAFIHIVWMFITVCVVCLCAGL